MNNTTLFNIRLNKSGVVLKTISTGLMAQISVYDLDDNESYLIMCYKELAEKVSRMGLQPKECIIASGRMTYLPSGDGFKKVLKATSVEYSKASAKVFKPEPQAVEEAVVEIPNVPKKEKGVDFAEMPEEINLGERDIFADMLLSQEEIKKLNL